MEYLLQLVSSLTDNPTHTRWLFTAIMGLAIALLAVAGMFVFTGLTDPVRRRMSEVTDGGNHRSTSQIGNAISSISGYALPKKEAEISKMRSRLVHAGYRTESAYSTFYAIKLFLTLVAPAIVILGATVVPGLSTLQVVFFAVLASFIGMILPNIILDRRVKKRQREILNGFPDALDLLVACTEAGLGLNAALQRVADELIISYPILTEELALVNSEIRAGIERPEALKNLADRTGIKDIRGLVSLLAQCMRFGTSIADALRVYSEEFRDKRTQRAEEQAAKLGTKLIFPMVFCIFPSFFVVAIGPALIGVIRALQGANITN